MATGSGLLESLVFIDGCFGGTGIVRAARPNASVGIAAEALAVTRRQRPEGN
jgi:hypothetical protein